MVIRQPSGWAECVALCLCDRVLFFRRGQAMPVSPAGITHFLWRRCEVHGTHACTTGHEAPWQGGWGEIGGQEDP